LFRALYKRKIPIVITLHNFRLLDPSASLFYKGHAYMPHLKADFPWESVRRKVLNNSLLKTFWTAFTYYLHKKIGTWHYVDKYLTFSNFAKQCLTDSSLQIKSDRIAIKPNFAKPLLINEIITSRLAYFVYIGRLSEEKGISTLLKAFSRTDKTLKIFGDGPLRDEVLQYAHRYPNIQYEGFQDKAILNKHLLACQALVVPSICYEGMPLSILEAFSVGTPVLASKLGILEEMIQERVHGLHFEANDPESTRATLDKWQRLSEEDKQKISANCHKAYLDKYSPRKNVILLESIYQETIQNRKNNE
ncbi:MAG TPA: glycosyltransferase family 4 protein, partial [Sphingobacterium sp.]|nr:glycosyltransferase family 4 protein [Sphingobacterium sp.]